MQVRDIRKRHFEALGRHLHAYFALEIDGTLIFTSKEQDCTDWVFSEVLKLYVALGPSDASIFMSRSPAYPSSKLKFVLCRHSKLQGSMVLAEFEAPLLKYLDAKDDGEIIGLAITYKVSDDTK